MVDTDDTDLVRIAEALRWTGLTHGGGGDSIIR